MSDNSKFYNIASNEFEYRRPEDILRFQFRYNDFRPGQKNVIDSILSGKDTVVVMPSGAGKSICYQIPAVLLPGITLVISPLISHIQEQIKVLNMVGISSLFLNNSFDNFDDVSKKIKHGFYKIIYVTPEDINIDGFAEYINNLYISLIVIEESHFISKFGHDFRINYMKIVEIIKMLKTRPTICALSSIATEKVRKDIGYILGLNNPYEIISGFKRKNILFKVEKLKSKKSYLLKFISEYFEDNGIIYCATCKIVDETYEIIKKRGISVAKYHEEMDETERIKMQNDFVFGYKRIIVATNALKNEINKPDIRFIIHYNMPQSIESYYQETVNAGRDGIDSKCIILFSLRNMYINYDLLEYKKLYNFEQADRLKIKQLDMYRFKIVQRYCYTTECLQSFITDYFGEKSECSCKVCSNCLSKFNSVNMTNVAKNIINCVFETRERHGINLIIDILTGVDNKKLHNIGAVKLKSYGALCDMNKNIIKRVIEQMFLEGFIVTSGKYQSIKLGDFSKLKNPDTTFYVNVTDDDYDDKNNSKIIDSKEKELVNLL